MTHITSQEKKEEKRGTARGENETEQETRRKKKKERRKKTQERGGARSSDVHGERIIWHHTSRTSANPSTTMEEGDCKMLRRGGVKCCGSEAVTQGRSQCDLKHDRASMTVTTATRSCPVRASSSYGWLAPQLDVTRRWQRKTSPQPESTTRVVATTQLQEASRMSPPHPGGTQRHRWARQRKCASYSAATGGSALRSDAFSAAPVSVAFSSALEAAGAAASPDAALPESNTCCREPLAQAPLARMPSALGAALAAIAGAAAGDGGAADLAAAELVATLLAAAAGSESTAGSDTLL